MKYEDMLDLPHPDPQNHPRMSRNQRAAQFAPFAALVGYDAAIQETARQTDNQIFLDADRIAELNEKLESLQAQISERPLVQITYFVPDKRKNGGAYQTVSGKLKKIDTMAGMLLFEDIVGVPIDMIMDISMTPV